MMNSMISPLLNIKYPPVRHWLKAGAFFACQERS
nr:MAG TPA: G-protein-signaling modulator 2, Protein inscuteable repeat, TPR, cell polarity.6A [Caudoviricetes sp.]